MQNYIIIADMNRAVSDRLTGILARQGWLVSAADSLAALQRQIEQYGPPALLICSAHGPAPDAERMRRMRETGGASLLAIVEETAAAEDHETTASSAESTPGWLTADDFIFWPAGDEEIRMRVERLIRMSGAILDITATCLGTGATPNGRHAHDSFPWAVGGPLQEQDWRYCLSPTERKIMRKLLAGQGKPVSMEQLAEAVDAPELAARIKALRVHINRLRKKIESNPNQPRIILTVRGYGYRLGLRTARMQQLISPTTLQA